MPKKSYNRSVFINCPFDNAYKPLLRAALFTVLRCGFHARGAQEEDDSSELRLTKIFRMIMESRYGIHDLSRTQLDGTFPRFNMPLELGIFLGAKFYGREEQDRKACLILEGRPHSYERYISDIKGQDIKSHENKPQLVVLRIREWLGNKPARHGLPGGSALWREYKRFKRWLPARCRSLHITDNELMWGDFVNLIYEWFEKRSDEPS